MRTRTSLPGIVATLALLAGQAGSALHMVVIDHHRCVLHGELIETGHADAPGATSSPSERPALAAAVEHHHDHCAIALLGRGIDVCPEARPAAPPSSTASHVLPPHAQPPAPHVLLVAPKTSPPSVSV